jgi:hypothetical protein
MRLLGREAMQGWAEKRVELTGKEILRRPQIARVKKLSWHTKFGEIEVLGGVRK